MRSLIVMALLCSSAALAQIAEPTDKEIAEAYRSKTGESVTVIPGVRWETWSIRNIRGWSLRFKRVGEKKTAAILTRRYRAVAKKNGSCAEYRITDIVPLPPVNPQIKPRLVVEADGVKSCR